MIKILISGIAGRMGQELLKEIEKDKEFQSMIAPETLMKRKSIGRWQIILKDLELFLSIKSIRI